MGAYYIAKKEEGSDQFKFWLAENKHDHRKIIKFQFLLK